MHQRMIEDNVFGQNLVQIVNPNPGWPNYVMVRDTIQVEMPPMVIKSIDPLIGKQMVDKARTMWNDMKQQASAEKQQGMICSMSQDGKIKSMVDKYLDKEGQPRTKVPPRPFLVMLNTMEGKNHYKNALVEAKIKGFELPAKEESANEFGGGVQKLVDVERPMLQWGKDRLLAYVDEKGGTIAKNDDEEKLLRKATKLFDAYCKMLDRDAGVLVNVKE